MAVVGKASEIRIQHGRREARVWRAKNIEETDLEVKGGYDALDHEKHGPPGASSVTVTPKLDVRIRRSGLTPSTGSMKTHAGTAPSSMSPALVRLSLPTMHQPSSKVCTTARRSPGRIMSSSGRVVPNTWRTLRMCDSSKTDMVEVVETP